jgi:hypothetical protein
MVDCVKIYELGVEKFGSPGRLQRELVRRGAEVTEDSIRKSIERGSESLNVRVMCALVDALYGGNWAKFGADCERWMKQK